LLGGIKASEFYSSADRQNEVKTHLQKHIEGGTVITAFIRKYCVRVHSEDDIPPQRRMAIYDTKLFDKR
jgi:hypothetical protein